MKRLIDRTEPEMGLAKRSSLLFSCMAAQVNRFRDRRFKRMSSSVPSATCDAHRTEPHPPSARGTNGVLYLAAILGTALAIQAAGSWGPLALAEDSNDQAPVWTAVEAMMGGAQSKPKQERPGKAKPTTESSLKSSIESAESKPASPDKAVRQTGSDPVKPAESRKDNLEAEKEARDSAPDAPGKSGVDLMQAALNLEKKKQYSEALDTYKIALKKGSHTDSKKIQAAALSGMGRVSAKTDRMDQAIKYLSRSIELNKELKNARARSLDYLELGRIFMDQTRYVPAYKALEESLKLLPKSEDARRPGLMEDLATCKLRLNKYPQAMADFNRLLAMLSKNGDLRATARIHLTVGEMLISRSDYRKARDHFKKAEAIFRKQGPKDALGETLYRLAYLDQVDGRLKEAEAQIEAGKKLLSAKRDKDIEALPLFVNGLHAYDQGDMVSATRDLAAAMDRYKRMGDRTMAARALLALGNAEKSRSRYDAALRIGGEALMEFRALSDMGGESGAVQLVGEVYFKQGFVQKGLEYAQEAHALARKVGDRSRMCDSKVLLADIHSTMGDTDFAWKLVKEAIQDSSSGLDPRIVARARLAAARLRLTRNALEKALDDVKWAEKPARQVQDRRALAQCDHIAGQVLELRGNQKKALELFNRSLEEYRAIGDREGEGRCLAALGIHYKNLGDHKKALSYFQKSLEQLKGIQDMRGYAANLVNIGNLMKHSNRFPEAQKNLDNALKLYRELKDKKGEADVLTNMGNLLAARGAQTEAMANFGHALEIHKEIFDVRGMATDLAGLGRLQLTRGELEEASNSLEEALKLNRRIVDPRVELVIVAELAMVQRARRNTAQALDLLNKALAKAKYLHDSRAESSIQLKMAMVLEDAGKYGDALALLKQTLARMKGSGDRKGELWALGQLGIIQSKMEDYENALTNLKRALDLRAELGLPSSQSRDLDFHLGKIYEGFKDYEAALDHFHKSLAVAQISGSEGMLGRIYDRIAGVYYQIDEYEKAKDFYEDALRIHSESGATAMQKTELIQLGDIASKLGHNEEALKYQLRALNITRETEDPATEARILTRIGTLNQMLGRPKTALEYYKQAKEKRIALGDRRGVNENLLQIALITSMLGSFESAVTELKEALQISQCSEDRSMLWKAYFIMGRALQGKKRLGEAMEAYRKAIGILESIEEDTVEDSDEDDFIFGGKKALFETTLNVLMKLAKKDPEGAYDNQALRIVEKLSSASFENTLSRINVDGFSDLPKELLIKEKSLRYGLRKLNHRLSEERAKLAPAPKEIDRLLKERREKEQAFKALKQRLEKEYPSYASMRYPKPVSVPHLQKAVLTNDEAVLRYMVTRSRTYIFALDKRRFHTYSVDYALRDLDRDVKNLMRPLYRADTQSNWDPSIAYRIYQRLVKPVEYFLAGKKTVVIIPHGPLTALPFETLICSEAHAKRRFWSALDRPTYLVQRYAFCYAPSASTFAYLRTRAQKRRPGWSLVAFGDAVYQPKDEKSQLNEGADKLLASLPQASAEERGSGLHPLPGARKEISEIAKIVGDPVQIYTGAQATESLFKKADLGRYGYIHLATHGVLLSGIGKLWQQPAIAFSLYGDKDNDGFLQLGEVFGLKLNSDLVVVSSCLSPPMDKENTNRLGLESLSRAFLFAGTDSVVLSMWHVNDLSTADLFIEMYKGLKDGSKAEALRKAKVELLKKQGYAHPYYWAPFVLVGDWKVKYPPGFNRMDPQKMRFKGLSTWRKFLSM